MAAPTSFSMTQLQGPVNRLGSRADGCFGRLTAAQRTQERLGKTLSFFNGPPLFALKSNAFWTHNPHQAILEYRVRRSRLPERNRDSSNFNKCLMTATVPVKPELIRWAIERSQLPDGGAKCITWDKAGPPRLRQSHLRKPRSACDRSSPAARPVQAP